MVTDLFAPVVSITTTKRRRFFWAAWTSAPPGRVPFRRPDASDGGATSFDEALAAAESRTAHTLLVVDPLWARAWIRIVRGEDPFPSRASREPHRPAPRAAPEASVWTILGVDPRTVTADELKAAYRRKVLETHPDRGGTDAAFQEVMHAYEDASARLRRPRRKD